MVVVVAVWSFWDSSERTIRALLGDGEQAVETEDIARAMSHVSRQYLDENGLNYLAVRRVLGWAFNRFDGFDIRLRDVAINVEDGSAIARGVLQVLVVHEGDNAYLIGDAGMPESVTISLLKGPLGWRVTSVNGIDARGLACRQRPVPLAPCAPPDDPGLNVSCERSPTRWRAAAAHPRRRQDRRKSWKPLLPGSTVPLSSRRSWMGCAGQRTVSPCTPLSIRAGAAAG